MNGTIIALSKRSRHHISKINVPQLQLLAGLGVEGDAHAGKTVKHRSRVAVDPTQPNLRQVHLIHTELFEELHSQGFDLQAGEMGENISTQGLDLLSLPQHTLLYIGSEAVVEITGLRNPCKQLDGLRAGLLKALAYKDSTGKLVRKAGIMGIVLKGGLIQVGDNIRVDLPPEPHLALERV